METFALTGASISLLQKRGEKVSRRRLSFLRLVAALLASAASSSSAAGEIPLIRVERNVRVSSGNPERLHHEVGMAASPTDPRRPDVVGTGPPSVHRPRIPGGGPNDRPASRTRLPARKRGRGSHRRRR